MLFSFLFSLLFPLVSLSLCFFLLHTHAQLPDYLVCVYVLFQIAEAYRDSRDFVERSFQYYSEPLVDKLLPDQNVNFERYRVPTLVIDLDEVLVKSDWKRGRGWRVYKRPGVEDFLTLMTQYYEV